LGIRGIIPANPNNLLLHGGEPKEVEKYHLFHNMADDNATSKQFLKVS
jgi:hypothetical protein